MYVHKIGPNEVKGLLMNHQFCTLIILLSAFISACSVEPGEDINGLKANTSSGPDKTSIDINDPAVTDSMLFNAVHEQIIQAACAGCHMDSSLAGETGLVFILGAGSAEFANKAILDQYLLSGDNQAQLTINKASGTSQHGGGTVLSASSNEYALLANYIDRITQATTIPNTEPDITIPDTDPDTTIPNTDPDTTIPNTDPDTKIPDTDPDTTFPNTDPDTKIPDTDPDTKIPDTGPDDMDLSNITSFSMVHEQVIQTSCVRCHIDSSLAGATNLVFIKGDESELDNKETLDQFLALNDNQAQIIKDKARGLNQHGGGAVLAFSSDEYALWALYIDSITADEVDLPDNDSSDNSYTLESQANTYRRASLIITGEIPTAETLNQVNQLSENGFSEAIKDLFQTDGFHEFIKTSANDQLLLRRLKANAYREVEQGIEKHYSEYKNIATSNTERDELAKELEEEPLELIAYIVENDKPYSEILTADYTMASLKTSQLFKLAGTGTENFKPAINAGQSLISGRFTDFEVDQSTLIPHAGILTSYAFLNKFPTTATNRNRARASVTLKHFLGFDIEDSSSRELSNDALSDSNNPTMDNPACTSCHAVLDPIAGAFQNFGDQGVFRDRRYGMDSLDGNYAETDKDSLYQAGDTWYRDMREPGFYNDISHDNSKSLNWLAHKLVADTRFATGTVKFWWPAIFGQQPLPNSSERHHYDAQALIIESLADDFRQHLNLKTLLLNMVMSDYFRALKKLASDSDAVDISIHSGGKRLLTPEQLQAKTKSLTGFVWDKNNPKLIGDYNIYFGGIDSNEVETRSRSISNVMSRVAEKNALTSSCSVVATEFNLPQDERKLFTEVERKHAPGAYYSGDLNLSNFNDSGVQNISYKVNAAVGTVKVLMKAPTKAMAWESLKITDSKGQVIIQGNMASLVADTDWISASGGPINSKQTNSKSAYYLCCSNRYLEILIPVANAGEITIEMAMWADNDASLNLAIEQTQATSKLTDNNTRLVKQQLVVLYERLLNEHYTIEDEEISMGFDLFMNLRQAKLDRGAHSDMKERSIDCLYYDNKGLSESEWGADPAHTMTAWRAVIAAMMMDSAFIYE